MPPVVLTAGQVAELVGGKLVGSASIRVAGVADLESARRGDISFLASRRYLAAFGKTEAGSVLVDAKLTDIPPGLASRILVEDPHGALRCLLETMYPSPPPVWGVSPSVALGRGVSWEGRIAIGHHSVIEGDVTIGSDCVIGAGAHILQGAIIGNNCILDDDVTICGKAVLGDRIRVKSGARIGTPGFGFTAEETAHLRIPQLGRCLIESDVEIGANTTIDRGTLSDTLVGAGTKIDNLVHIAHNVRIGAACIILAQVGVAGSTEVGEKAILAGQAGLAGHVRVGSRARVAAQSGVIGDIPPDAIVSGYPARSHRNVLRQAAALARIAPLVDEIEDLVKSRDNT